MSTHWQITLLTFSWTGDAQSSLVCRRVAQHTRIEATGARVETHAVVATIVLTRFPFLAAVVGACCLVLANVGVHHLCATSVEALHLLCFHIKYMSNYKLSACECNVQMTLYITYSPFVHPQPLRH